jgi:neopullulanase
MRKILLALALSGLALPVQAQSFRDRAPEDEVIYFLLPDRFENGDPRNDKGGIKGDRLKTGYDPTQKGFYHGGDIKGLTQRLDYIQKLGATAIWLAPVFKNKPVQGAPGQESAGYHGYWVTDFTTVDPHFGTEADFKAFVDAAHVRGMKVYMDIIANHTADVISYAECKDKPCPYRSRSDYPYQRRTSDGAAINAGFAGDSVQTADNFARLTDPNFAYTVRVPEAEAHIKKPDWLNDPLLYHNRGNSTFAGESSTMGDFVGLDDVMTEHPRVLLGFSDIYASWIDRFGVDGFRIDTAKHVNPEFWSAFSSTMLERAKARGIPNFHIFGEMAADFDPVTTAHGTRVAKLPSVLDFAFRKAVDMTLAGETGTDIFEKLLLADPLYEGGEAAAHRLPTFTGNHDAGRFAHYARKAFPHASDEEILKRTMLSNALLFTMRGVPTVYSGDEQGFTGDGNDQDAREDMFPSRVASYNDNRLIGSIATTAQSNFDPSHPLFRQIVALAKARQHPQLRDGRTILRYAQSTPGLLAFSRILDGSQEMLIAVNTSTAPITAKVEVDVASTAWRGVAVVCSATPFAPGSVEIALEPLGYTICEAQPSK